MKNAAISAAIAFLVSFLLSSLITRDPIGQTLHFASFVALSCFVSTVVRGWIRAHSRTNNALARK
jgi:hypothetical protein